MRSVKDICVGEEEFSGESIGPPACKRKEEAGDQGKKYRENDSPLKQLDWLNQLDFSCAFHI
jgi:hypothetical protein